MTLYRLISGELPYKGREVAALLRSMQVPPPALQRAPAELDAVVRRAMASDLDARLGSARALAEALQPFLAGDEEPFELDPAPSPAPLRLDLALGLGSAAQKLTRDAPGQPAPATPQRARPAVDHEALTRPGRRPVAPQPPASVAADDRSWATPNAPLAARPPVEASAPAAPLPAAPWRSWQLWVLASLLVVGSFAAGSQLATRSAANSLSTRASRLMAQGEAGVAEGLLLDSFEAVRADTFTRGLVAPLLAARRTSLSLFDPAFELSPSVFQGAVTEPRLHQASEFVLDINHVEPHFFTGTMTWPGSKVSVRGLHEGNQVLFVDYAPAGPVVDGYVFNEKKAAFLVLRGAEVMLEGVDGPFHLPLSAKLVAGGSARRPTARVETPRVAVSDDELDEWVAWRRQRLQLERDAQAALDRASKVRGDAALSDTLTELHDELAARRRRLTAQSPVSIAQEQALDDMVNALFSFDSRTLNPRPLNEPWREQALAEKYPNLFARVRTRRSVMFEAWYVPPPRVK